jgi:hypothetical protein
MVSFFEVGFLDNVFCVWLDVCFNFSSCAFYRSSFLKKCLSFKWLLSLHFFLFDFLDSINFDFRWNFCQKTLTSTVFNLFIFGIIYDLITSFFSFYQLFGVFPNCIKFFYGSFMIHTVKVLIIAL